MPADEYYCLQLLEQTGLFHFSFSFFSFFNIIRFHCSCFVFSYQKKKVLLSSLGVGLVKRMVLSISEQLSYHHLIRFYFNIVSILLIIIFDVSFVKITNKHSIDGGDDEQNG